MTDLIRTRVMLPPGSPVDRGPQWTDLWIREGTSDEDVLREVWVEDVYRVRGLAFAEHAYETRDAKTGVLVVASPIPPLVIDLGACTGLFTALMCALYPDIRVIAVEPQAENLELLKRNVARFADRVTVLDRAVGAWGGKAAISGEGATAHTGHGHGVLMLTLAQLIETADVERVALLKCDIEGAEYETFLATPCDVLARVDRIVMEWHGPEMCPWVEGHMERHYGALLTHFARTHAVQTFGHPHRGGMLFAQRYNE